MVERFKMVAERVLVPTYWTAEHVKNMRWYVYDTTQPGLFGNPHLLVLSGTRADCEAFLASQKVPA